ncbi:MAG: hypothetical protein AB1772_11535 [Candidatus Zixiibacteriota bacterium]
MRATKIIVLALFLCSCATLQPRKQAPAFDQITLNIRAVAHEGDPSENQWLRVCAVLNRYGSVDCANYERTNCQQVGSVRVCDFDNIVLKFSPPLSLDRLLRLHRDLQGLEREGISLGLANATFAGTYLSLATRGTLSIRVRIAVTPGATLFLERRFPGVCEKVETPDNVFFDEISLRPGQEWIYYRTELKTSGQPVRRYFRLNVSSKLEQELSPVEFNSQIGKS